MAIEALKSYMEFL